MAGRGRKRSHFKLKNDFFAIYDALLAGIDGDEPIVCRAGRYWSMAETASGMGLAMHTEGDSIPPMFPAGLDALRLRDAASAMKSWNFEEAGFGLAAANAFYNTPARMEALGCFEPFEKYSTEGLDFTGKTVGLIGHMRGPEGMREKAKAVYVLERAPQPGDYPDSACDLLLPQCDIVLITGSSLVNKTLPHLLELCRDAYTIVTGPSVPMCPALLECGIDRLAGLVVDDRDGIRGHVLESRRGHPYGYGRPFLLRRDA